MNINSISSVSNVLNIKMQKKTANTKAVNNSTNVILNNTLSFIYDNVLSILMMVLLIAVGLFLSIKTGFLQFRRFGYILKNTIGQIFNKSLHQQDKNSVSPFQAVTTALAGTIGTGSIAGVSTALVLGGPGAVFWMWISALLGMVTKYSEIVLALNFREKKHVAIIKVSLSN